MGTIPPSTRWSRRHCKASQLFTSFAGIALVTNPAQLLAIHFPTLTARTLFAGTSWSMNALVIPADPQEPVRMIDLDAGSDQVKNLQKEVGGVLDIVGHMECDLVINDEGRINGSPVNA
jgi:hypothetical protein